MTHAFLWPTVLALTLFLLLLYKQKQRTANSYHVVYRCFQRYPLQVFEKLHERAVAAAGAWVDDIDPEGYQDIMHTDFFVQKNVICVRVHNTLYRHVDVFFTKQRGEWQRANIFYEGVKIR